MVKQYLDEIGTYDLLDAEGEVRLATTLDADHVGARDRKRPPGPDI